MILRKYKRKVVNSMVRLFSRLWWEILKKKSIYNKLS